MKLSDFLVEQDMFKPRVRLKSSAVPFSHVPSSVPPSVTPPVKKKRGRGPAKSPMVARKQAAPAPQQQTSNSIDFDPSKIGPVGQPQQRTLAGERVRKQPVTKPNTVNFDPNAIGPVEKPQQRTLAGETPPPVASTPAVQPTAVNAPPTEQPVTPADQDQISKQVLTVANQAIANKNPQQLEQLLQMLRTTEQTGPAFNKSGRAAATPTMRDQAQKVAKRMYDKLIQKGKPFQSMVAQTLANMSKSGV